MRLAMRLFIATMIALSAGVMIVLAQTQNQIPKYAAGGSLVDSAITESGGKVGMGTTSPSHALSVTGNTGFQANFWNATNPGINIGDNVSHLAAGTKRLQVYVDTTNNYAAVDAFVQGG